MSKVACIGECMIELKQAEGGLFSRFYGGDTLNTAIYLARLGTGEHPFGARPPDAHRAPSSRAVYGCWR
jgi:pfkB family carbohydrate kinase